MSKYELRPRANGVFYIHWTEPVVAHGKTVHRSRRLSTGTRSLEEAQQVFASFLIEGGRQAGRPGEIIPSVAQVLDDYMREHGEPKTMTAPRSRSKVKHLKSFFGDDVVADIDIPRSRAYAEWRRSTGRARKGEVIADSTISSELILLVSAMNHAVRWKRLRRDDVPAIEMPEPVPARERWLTVDELARLLDAAKETDPGLHLFCMLAYYTAARRGALEELKWFQVDLDINVINLQPPGRRRTKKRRPPVPIDARLLPLLLEHRKAATSERVLPGRKDYWYPFRTLCDRLGMDDVTPHTMRHTRATHLLRAGKDPWAVAGLLGDTLKTLMSTYGHHCPEHIRKAIEDEIVVDTGVEQG